MYIVDNRSVYMLKGSMILQNSWKLHTSRKQVKLRQQWQISRSNEEKTWAMKTTLYQVKLSPVLSSICRAHLILSELPNCNAISLCSGHTYLSKFHSRKWRIWQAFFPYTSGGFPCRTSSSGLVHIDSVNSFCQSFPMRYLLQLASYSFLPMCITWLSTYYKIIPA